MTDKFLEPETIASETLSNTESEDEEYVEEEDEDYEEVLTFVIAPNQDEIIDLTESFPNTNYNSDDFVLTTEIGSIWSSFLENPTFVNCKTLIEKCHTKSCDNPEGFVFGDDTLNSFLSFSDKQIESFLFFFQNEVKCVIESYNNPKCTHLDINCLFKVKGITCKLGFVSNKLTKISSSTRKIQVNVYSLSEVLGIFSKEEKTVKSFDENIRAVIELFCKTIDLINNGVYNTLSHKLTSKKEYEQQASTVKHLSQLLNSNFYSECSVCFDLTHKQYCIQCKNKICEICYDKLPYKYVEAVDYGVKTCPTCREPLPDEDENEEE